jgi:spermidine/putrescine transport system ATP-binding protein
MRRLSAEEEIGTYDDQETKPMTVCPEPLMLEIVDAVHRYGNVTALDHVSLSARRGEFLTILGSSGSGKTTMLRVISGLETPVSVSTLKIGGEDVAGRPPAKRSCTTVFQSYALFPHMSVEENVAYGLKIRGIGREQAQKDAHRALAMVQLEAKATRRIAQLSGGERQRVALARAVVTRPSILLLDEPLGALDEKLRIEMQMELVELQRTLGMTFIYITHSREEALTMSDRIVLMRHGRIEQSGRPLDLFDRPANRFAAEFMGYENILEGTLRGYEEDLAVVELAGGYVVRGVVVSSVPSVDGAVCVAVRAERLETSDHLPGLSPSLNMLPCTLQRQTYRGKYTDQAVDTQLGQIRLRSWNCVPSTTTVQAVAWRPEDCVIFPA